MITSVMKVHLIDMFSVYICMFVGIIGTRTVTLDDVQAPIYHTTFPVQGRGVTEYCKCDFRAIKEIRKRMHCVFCLYCMLCKNTWVTLITFFCCLSCVV